MKRQRDANGSARNSNAVRRAIAINSKINKKFPYKTYGRAYLQRGTEENIQNWGKTWKEATPEQRETRRRFGYYGQGKYSFRNFLGDARKAIGSKILRAAENRIVGAISGGGIPGMGLYGGQGSYSANQLMDDGRSSSTMSGANDETDEITISDTEFVQDIYAPTINSGSSSFNSQILSCNPGLPQFAPNLSQLAANFTEYELLQLVYELRPVISDSNVNNGLTGIAMMVFNYNANEDLYDNKEDVMQAHGSVSGRIVDKIVCGVECDPAKINETQFFIRTGPVPYGKDNDEYDMGQLTIATNNIPSTFSNLQIYELWVTYRVKLRKRRPAVLKLLNQIKDIFKSNDTVNCTSLFSNIATAGQNGVGASTQNNIGGSLTSSGSQNIKYTFPAALNGNFQIMFLMDGTGMTTSGTPVTVTLTGNVTKLLDMYGAYGDGGTNDTPDWYTFSFSQGDQAIVIIHIKVRSATSGTDNTFNLAFGFNGGTNTQWQLSIEELTSQHWQSKTKPQPLFQNITDSTILS